MDNFIETIKHSILSELGQDYMVAKHEVLKNNGSKRHGLTICEAGSNISPVIYLDDYLSDYEQGRALKDIIADILNLYQQNKSFPSFDSHSLMSFHQAKEKIIFQLINTERNTDFLKDIPHIPFLDFSIIFKMLIESSTSGMATMTITQSLLDSWNIPVEEVRTVALANTPLLLKPQIEDIREILGEYAGEEIMFQDSSAPFYILSNSQRQNGCNCILYPHVLHDFAKSLGQNLYILPSSLHETILLPIADNTSTDTDSLFAMVRDVNGTVVSQEDFLSDNIYFYNKDTKELNIVDDCRRAAI